MKYLILALIATTAQASEYSMYYTINGKQVETGEALLRSLKGETVMKCQSVEAKPSKTGTSIGMRNVKKPKASE